MQKTRPLTYGHDLSTHLMSDTEVLGDIRVSIKVLENDIDDPVKGEIWFNSNTSELKICVDDAGTVVTISAS